jgi:hypothetical protein
LEFRYGMAKPYIYVQRLFTDNGADEKATKFEIIESHEHYRLNLASQNAKFVKHFYLYMLVEGLQSYIKVYSLMYNYDSSAATKFTIAPVKKVRYIEDCSNFWRTRSSRTRTPSWTITRASRASSRRRTWRSLEEGPGTEAAAGS